MCSAHLELRAEKNRSVSGAVKEEIPERESVKINLTPEAMAVITAMRSETGTIKIEAMSRIVEWFASLPLKLRLAVLNRDDRAQDELLVDWFREHLARKALNLPPLEPDDVAARVKIIHEYVDHLRAGYESKSDTAAVTAKKKRG
jgi:hypothetical protein